MLEDWTIYSWYCPNCKTQVAGLKNKKNQDFKGFFVFFLDTDRNKKNDSE